MNTAPARRGTKPIYAPKIRPTHTFNAHTHKKDKAILLQTEQSVYQLAIELCLARYELNKEIRYLKKAFEISERDKSVLLMENLHQEDALKFGGVPDSLIRKEKHRCWTVRAPAQN